MKRIDDFFTQAIAQQVFSASQVLLGRGKQRLFLGHYGTPSGGVGEAPLSAENSFDIASLSKPVVTATLVMQAVREGKFAVAQRVSDLLPGFIRTEITVRHLLEHCSGLPDWLPIYEDIDLDTMSSAEVRDHYLKVLNEVPLVNPVGTQRVYSDLGFILLGFILEEQYGKPLDQLFDEKIAQGIGLSASVFNPLRHGFAAAEIVATDCVWRKKLLRGEVHDDNAFVLGGVAGHAGLFSNVLDLEKYVHWLWEHWEADWMQAFLGAAVMPKLGWDTPSQPGSQAGQYFSKDAFGHLAFTGCSLWLDPRDQKYIILLTNRVRFANDKAAIKAFRPMIHDALIEQRYGI